MTAQQVSISIVIVAWNSWDVLPACLDAIAHAAARWPGVVEVLVVDNASADKSGEQVGTHFPEVTVLQQAHNLGFARAVNVGLEASTGDAVLLLNPDVEIHPDTLSVCASRLEQDSHVGVVGVRMTDGDGLTQPESARRFPSEWWLFCETLFLHRLWPRTRLFGGLNFGEWDHLDEREVPCLLGAFLMFRGSLLRALGGLDESVFMYYEDIDICQRVWSAGSSVLYLPAPAARHIAGASRAKTTASHSASLDALKGEVIWRFTATHRRPRWRARLISIEIVLYAVARLLLLPILSRFGARRRSPQQIWRANLALLSWAVRPKRLPQCE
jgi:GT2 family glycosyltransferase